MWVGGSGGVGMVDREGIWGCRYVIEAFIQCTCRYGQE